MIENNIPNPQRMMKTDTIERMFLENESKFIFVVFKNQFNDNSEGWSKMTQVVEIDKYTINEKSVLIIILFIFII